MSSYQTLRFSCDTVRKMNAKPAHHRLRELLLHVLRTDADFEAFVMDRHETVAQRFSAGQERTQKTNLLLWHVAGQVLLQELKESWPQAVASFESQHGSMAATDFLDRLRFQHSGSWVRTQAMMFAMGAGLVAGLWLTLHAVTPSKPVPRPEAAQPQQAQPIPHSVTAPDMTQAVQTLAGVLTRSDRDGQFTLSVPGEPDEPVQLRIQPSDSSQAHDHWLSLAER